MRIAIVLAFFLSLIAASEAAAQAQGNRHPGVRADAKLVPPADFEWWCAHAARRHCGRSAPRTAAEFDRWCRGQRGKGTRMFLIREAAGCFR